MTRQRRRNGFLLLEALVSLSLLATGLLACFETLALVGDTTRRSRHELEVAQCAEKKWLEISLNVPIPEIHCPSEITWSVTAADLTGPWQRQILRGTWRDRDKIYEETFETIRAAG